MKTVATLAATLALLTTPASASDSQLYDLEQSLNFMDQFEQEMNIIEQEQANAQHMDQVTEKVVSFADKKYNVDEDGSWGDAGEKCDLEALDTKEMRKWKK